ncbi:phospholipase-like protein, partial [Tanacetum coccineum]
MPYLCDLQGIRDRKKYRADLKCQFKLVDIKTANKMILRHCTGRTQALEQETLDLDVAHKQMKMLKAIYGVTSPQELRNQAPGMVKPEFRGMMEKDIKDMTIVEYMEYEAEMKRQYEPLEEDIDYISDDESETVQGVSFVADDDIQNEEGVILGALPCQLLPKELNLESFTLPCTIGSLNLYAMEDLGASVNVIPKSIFEHLKLANLKETDMVVDMDDMTKKVLLGIVENILVKINKFLFPSDFVIINMLKEPSETMILGRPFLATIHAQIDVFNREISLGIREDKVLFDMDGGAYHSKILVEKVYMANSVQEEEYFNPLKIEDDVFSYKSPTCLLFEKCTRSCDNESIDTFDSIDNIQELEVNHEDMVQ